LAEDTMTPDARTTVRISPARPARSRLAPLALMAGLLFLVIPAAAAPAAVPADVVVHMADLPRNALYELELWKDRAAAKGKLVGVLNEGGELDPPPENDPHADFKVAVQAGVPYRVWLHMKVGKPKGKSKANLVYAQFTDAVDAENREVLKPRTRSFLRLEAPAKEGWVWIGAAPAPTVTFRTTGQITVRLQAGMEGVGFDQLVLSPARFLDHAPTEAVLSK
jgi:hypothetical protein